MTLIELLEEHVQSVRNRRCGCGWRPDYSLDQFQHSPGHQHRRHLSAVIHSHNFQQQQYLTDGQLYADGETALSLPGDTFVESADGSVWRVEPDFGWDCVSEGSCTLMGPARLLVMGGGQE